MSTTQRLSLWWLLLFFVTCYAIAGFGSQFTPGDWYQELERAPWNPPNAAFPIVWTILYAMIALAGWLIFSTTDKALKSFWVIQILLNGAWSWIFFGQQWMEAALFEIVVLVVVVGLLIKRCFSTNQKTAAWLLSPYLLWLLVATSLNAYIVAFN